MVKGKNDIQKLKKNGKEPTNVCALYESRDADKSRENWYAQKNAIHYIGKEVAKDNNVQYCSSLL